jgi:hypothetical protein
MIEKRKLNGEIYLFRNGVMMSGQTYTEIEADHIIGLLQPLEAEIEQAKEKACKNDS